MKDCVISETYLAYARALREHSKRTVVFVSSNTRDFANERGNDVANEIRDEFLGVQLAYAPNMRMAGCSAWRHLPHELGDPRNRSKGANAGRMG